MKLLLLALCVGVAVAYEDSLYFVDELLSVSYARDGALVARTKAFFGKQLDAIESLAAKNENVKAQYSEEIATVRASIAALSGRPDMKFYTKVRAVAAQLRALRKKVNTDLSKKSYSAAGNSIMDAFITVKQYLSTDEGINTARDYIRSLEVNHPVMFMVKSFMEATTNEALTELLLEILKDIKYYMIQGADFHEAAIQIENFLRTDAGLQAVKNYFQNLQTSHQIISRLRTMVVSADDETIREFIDAILPPLYYILEGSNYDTRQDLLSLFKQIRDILITPEGIKVVKDYARALDVTHPVLFLVKAFISGAEDKILLEILDEVFKGVEYLSLEYASTAERLEDLFLQVKEILKTAEGVEILKNYISNLKSSHPIVSRVSAFVASTNDETLKDILNALFGDELLYALQRLGSL